MGASRKKICEQERQSHKGDTERKWEMQDERGGNAMWQNTDLKIWVNLTYTC